MKNYFQLNNLRKLLIIGAVILMCFTKTYALTGTRDLEAYTQDHTNQLVENILKIDTNASADPLLDNIKGQWVKEATEQGYQFAEGGRINIGDGKLYSWQEPGGVSTDLLDPSVYVMERAETTSHDIDDQLQSKYHLNQGYQSSTKATLVIDGKEITQTISEWFKTQSFLTDLRYPMQAISRNEKINSSERSNSADTYGEATNNQPSQGFSIPSYNVVGTESNVSTSTSFSGNTSSFITSGDIFVLNENNSASADESKIMTIAQLVNKCVNRCVSGGTDKTVCTKECNRPRCGCRDTDGNGVIEAVCEAGQFGKECLGVMSCDVRVCDNPDLLKGSTWVAPVTNINSVPNSTSTILTPDSSINVSAYQGVCPSELCSYTFYPGGLLSGLKCPGTQFCNKYWCKGNCLATCGTLGNDPYGMCPDAGTVCCKPASGNPSSTLEQLAVDSCPSTYCKPVCDSLRENDVGHKTCNGFECCIPNYNIGNCSSLGGECMGGCEGTKILGRDETLCLQGGICCQKGTGSNIVSYCGCENGQPVCGSQNPNGLQCSTDSQCSQLKCTTP